MFSKKDSGIFCPSCKMRNEVGAILCAYCRTPLPHNSQKTVTIQNFQETTGTLPDYFDDVLDAPAFDAERFMDFEIPSKGITLINIEDGRLIATQEEKAFILGRASNEVKAGEPLVDLANFGALDYGISRIHALIRQAKNGYQIVDLQSTNGTWIENKRIPPKQPMSLLSGDRIRLGRLHMLVFYLET